MSRRGGSKVPGERVYRLLLRLHPRAFRDRYEAELIGCFRDAWRAEARGAGARSAIGFWARTVAGTTATAVRQRLDGRVRGAGRGGHGRREREVRMADWRTRLEAVGMDIRFALRALRRRPGFTAAALLTLGLAIGTASAVYTVVEGILLDPLPFPASDRLYQVSQDGDDGSYWMSSPNYLDVKERLSAFEVAGAFTPDGANVMVDGVPDRVAIAEADADFFGALGVTPLLGRTFTAAERREGALVAVISHGLWQRRMGGRADALGATLELGGTTREVIGVLPAGEMIPAGTDVWIPLNLDAPEWRTRRGISWIQVVGRLRPEADPARLRAEAAALSASLRSTYPESAARVELGFRSVEEATVGAVRQELRLLMGAVALVLLVAAINIGGLLLARLSGRREEVAVRTALGGGRRRLSAQLFTESVVLAALGAVVGILFGRVALAGLLAVAPADTPRLATVAMGPGTVLFAVLAAGGAAVIFALATTLAPRRATIEGLRSGRGGAGRDTGRLRSGLVVAQVALALSLLFAAGLLAKSFWRMQRVDLGFAPQRVVVAGLPIDDGDFATPEAREAYYRAILDRAAALPGVRSAGLTNAAPFDGFGPVFSYEIPDLPAEPGGDDPLSRFRVATPGLFETLGLPLLRGRAFAESGADARNGAVVSDDLARRHFPDGDALGRRIYVAGDTFRIVGVVPSIRDFSATSESPFPFVYVPIQPSTGQSMALVVRTDGDPAGLVAPLRRMIAEVAPRQPVSPLQPMEALIGRSAARPRFMLAVLAFFAAATLILAAVGLYGLLAYAVGQRTREIGVRVALGAPLRAVRGLVVRQAVVLLAIGGAVGLALVLWGARFLEALLFQVEARDPMVLLIVGAVLAAVGLIAAWLPARRATRIAPMEALRAE